MNANQKFVAARIHSVANHKAKIESIHTFTDYHICHTCFSSRIPDHFSPPPLPPDWRRFVSYILYAAAIDWLNSISLAIVRTNNLALQILFCCCFFPVHLQFDATLCDVCAAEIRHQGDEIGNHNNNKATNTKWPANYTNSLPSTRTMLVRQILLVRHHDFLPISTLLV